LKVPWAIVGYWIGIGLLPVVEWLTAPPWAWDRAALALSAHLRNPALDAFFLAVTWAGSLYLLVPLTAVLVLRWHRLGQPQAAWLLSLSVIGASLVAHGMKLLLARPRPTLHAALTAMPADASFPSAHTAQITAFVVATLALRCRGRTPWTVANGMALITVVGISRIYLQVHYASDVVAGALLGALWALGLRRCQQAFCR